MHDPQNLHAFIAHAIHNQVVAVNGDADAIAPFGAGRTCVRELGNAPASRLDLVDVAECANGIVFRDVQGDGTQVGIGLRRGA